MSGGGESPAGPAVTCTARCAIRPTGRTPPHGQAPDARVSISGMRCRQPRVPGTVSPRAELSGYVSGSMRRVTLLTCGSAQPPVCCKRWLDWPGNHRRDLRLYLGSLITPRGIETGRRTSPCAQTPVRSLPPRGIATRNAWGRAANAVLGRSLPLEGSQRRPATHRYRSRVRPLPLEGSQPPDRVDRQADAARLVRLLPLEGWGSGASEMLTQCPPGQVTCGANGRPGIREGSRPSTGRCRVAPAPRTSDPAGTREGGFRTTGSSRSR